ncbi:MAG: class I SAM-dependent DNA methyltransferase, partial [Brevundimonas sp.]
MGWMSFISEYAKAGARERSNAQSYTRRLLDLLEVPQPGVAVDDDDLNDYVFERRVKGCAGGSYRWIDLYKKGCVLMEHKQSRWPGGTKSDPFADNPEFDPVDAKSLGGWDTLMRNARRQAIGYVADLPSSHPAPVFVVVCDVGRAFEVWADFSGTGRGYAPFPDRKTFRFRHLDLGLAHIQQRLRAIFLDPWSLDPAREAEVITREIMGDLACIPKRLEARDHQLGAVAHFLMRCVFTLFAADVGLLPKDKLIVLLEDCIASPKMFAPMMADLWRRFREPDYQQRFFSGFGEHVPHIGGDLFRTAEAFPLEVDEIALLLTAAHRRWESVEPSIFSELFEQALAPAEQRKLGAHFTPRAYVARLVELTVMQPLRQAWLDVQLQIEAARHTEDMRDAIGLARGFHHRLCQTRVLDPACGTGNFLFVAQELMKGLEGEVLDLLTDLGCSDELDIVAIQPSQFLGVELNPRAAQLADLVLRLGFLQQHYRNHTAHPAEPILQSGSAIRFADALLDWDGAPAAQHAYQASGLVQIWPNARPTPWPDAEFIIGNPPFIGGKDLRSRMDPGYAETLWRTYPQMNESADLVMYWWERAAQALTRPGTSLQRFGLVTTNSITQVFQRRTIERWMTGARPLSLVYAVADHPWSPAGPNAAAVRIAMTVAEAGTKDGVLLGCIDGDGSSGALMP